MEKKLNKFVLLSAMLLTLTSCGLDLKEIYKGDYCNSPVFVENYYDKYDSAIDPANPNNAIIKNDTEHAPITLERNQFATTFNEARNLKNSKGEFLEPGMQEKMQEDGSFRSDLDYTMIDRTDPSSYGHQRKLNQVDEMFKPGYLSKLYDGELFCNNNYQLARVQMNENGFGVLFPKEMRSKNYMALNFKMAFNDPNKKVAYPQHEISEDSVNFYDTDIKLTVSFYLKDKNNYHKQDVILDVEKVPTHRYETNAFAYSFVMFSLENINLERCCGYSLKYEITNNEYIKTLPEGTFNEALMLYEVLMPGSTWY